MKRLLALMVLASVLCFTAAPAAADDDFVFRKVKWGMNAEEVKKSEERPDGFVFVSETEADGGHVDQLVYRSDQLFGSPNTQVTYSFDVESGLSSIWLAVQLPAMGASGGVESYRRISDALTFKYGPRFFCDGDDSWETPQGGARIVFEDYDGDNISIVFTPPVRVPAYVINPKKYQPYYGPLASEHNLIFSQVQWGMNMAQIRQSESGLHGLRFEKFYATWKLPESLQFMEDASVWSISRWPKLAYTSDKLFGSPRTEVFFEFDTRDDSPDIGQDSQLRSVKLVSQLPVLGASDGMSAYQEILGILATRYGTPRPCATSSLVWERPDKAVTLWSTPDMVSSEKSVAIVYSPPVDQPDPKESSGYEKYLNF